MNLLSAKLGMWSGWKEAKRLCVSAIFEDSETCARVAQFFRDLSGDLGQQCQIIQHAWLVNEFRVPELKEIAADEAAHDDLIILAMHSDGSLPEHLQSWIDLWLSRKDGRPAVFGALLDPDTAQDSSSMHLCLQEIARRGNMEFFAQ